MGSKAQQKKHNVASEERVEAKPRHGYVEPTTIKNELKSISDGIIKSTWDDLLGASGVSLSEQVFGFGGQLQEGHAVSLKKHEESKVEKPKSTEGHMEYFRSINNADRIAESRTETQISQSVEQIRMEIKKLMATSKLVERTVKDATADQAPVKPGKYHVNFFEFVLGVIKDATRKLEDTVSYGAVFTSKKQQSKYWNAYKKSGTSFGLSGERTVATQVG